MSVENKYEMAPIKPGWISNDDRNRFDADLFKILVFFIINNPCEQISYRAIDLSQYGWRNEWKNNTLKQQLFAEAGLTRGETFVVAKKLDEMKAACEKANVKKGFHKVRDVERIAFYKSKDNEFISIFRHIRNSFAHGRFRIYQDDNGDDIVVMEDGIRKYNEIQVRARMVLRKKTLINWIDILEKSKSI